MKILVIEDEILILKSIQKLILNRGHLVDGTTSGEEAIKLILTNNYDRIISDLMLKDTTGFDIIEESKKIYSNDEIAKKFVLITAYTTDVFLSKAQNYNCKILKKPFTNIVNAIDSMLED
jgi:DNA-binding response OmpR family regulator